MTPTPSPAPPWPFRVDGPPDLGLILRIPAIILGGLAVAGLVWLLVQTLRYVAAGKQRPVLRLAWRIRRTWDRTAVRVGLARTEPVRPKWWSLSPPPATPTMRTLVPAILLRCQAWGVTVDVAAVGRVGLAEFRQAAPHLADAWRVPIVRVEQQRPGRVRLTALLADPLTRPLQWSDGGPLRGDAGRWVAGLDAAGAPVVIRTAEVSGVVVAGLPGYGKTTFLAARIADLARDPAVQLVLIDGKGGPDYDGLAARAWLFAKDEPERVRDHLVKVRDLMTARQHAIGPVLGVKNLWHVGPSENWPLIVIIVDEAHTFLNETKGTDPESKRLDAIARETARLVEELVRKGRNVGIQIILATQKATGDAIPTRIRDNCQVAISFAQRTSEAATAVLGADIANSPDEHPRRLVDPTYVGVASMAAQGRPGFTLVRTPYIPDHVADQIAAQTAQLVRDPTQTCPQIPAVGRRSPADAGPVSREGGGPFRQEDTAALRDTNPHQQAGRSRSCRL